MKRESPRVTRSGLETATDEELMALRLCDLPVELGGSPLTECLHRLYDELAARSLRFRPHLWLSDEWFCPDRVPGFAVPFYLAHPRLARLERSQMKEVEGGTRRGCSRLLRHETGHAIDNAFHLRRERARQRLFGPSTKAYPSYYDPRPFSRKFVRHLGGHYAQCHPDEDFAETFAVWLDPRSNWRERYRDWPVASRKLGYLDELMHDLAGRRPALRNRRRPSELKQLTSRLSQHYRAKRERFEIDLPSSYDEDLERIFSGREGREGEGGGGGGETAARFLTRQRRFFRRLVAETTGLHAYTVDRVLGDWITRCRERKLRLGHSKREEARLRVLTVLAARTVEFRKGGHHRLAL